MLKKSQKCNMLYTQWHPDKNPDNPEATINFQKISEAYAVLSDDKKRQLYNQYGIDGVNAADQMGDHPTGGHGGSGGSGPFFHGGFPGGGGGHTHTTHHFTQGGFPGGSGGGGMHMSDADAQQFFAQFFGHSDPFGGTTGFAKPSRSGRSSGHPRMTSSMGGAGHHDPFSMFGPMGGGMPMGGSFGGHDPFQPQPQRRSQVHVKRYDAIPNGTPVSLKGLISQPERNGDRGEVIDYDANAKRYTVLLEDTDDEKLRVKPDNLLQHVHVRLHSIESQPSLNGQRGTIIAWDGKKERYNIYVMDLSKTVSLKPNNVILDVGTVAQIVNLTSKPELNQQFGTIKSFIQDSNRYDVQLSEQQVIRIKLDNVRV